MYLKHQWREFYRPMFLRLGLVLLVFTLIRCLFYAIDKSQFPDFYLLELIKILVVSLRFDLSSVLYINTLYILTVLIPFDFRKNKIYKSIQKWIFLTFNISLICFEIGEIATFPVQLRRMHSSDFSVIFNTLDQWDNFLSKNWYLFIGGVVVFYLFSKIYDKFSPKEKSENTSKWSIQFLTQLLLIPSLIALYVVGARGGLQLRPITPISAADYVRDTRWIPLISNTTMNFLSSFQQNFIEKKTYLDEKAMISYNENWQYKPDGQPFRPMNVVVIAMESFGSDYTSTWNEDKGVTPFLDSLLSESLYSKNSFANACRSAQGIVAITAGIPQMMDDALQFSPYQNNRINSLASLLKEKGYYTAFFHASKPGSMMFDKYAGLAAYEHFEDKTSYPNPADDDQNWGIFDRPYFQYVVEKMNKMPQPFHTFTFSLTSHYPYISEKNFEAKHPDVVPYKRCVMYSDDALRQFFAAASKQSWFGNTLFVISADHTGGNPRPQYQTYLGKYRIPILFYCPKEKLKMQDNSTTLQQIDILPSVMDFLHYDKPFFSFGKSIFKQKKDNTLSINYIEGLYQVVSPKYNLVFDGEKTRGMYDYHKDILLQNDLSEKLPEEKMRLENYLKAVIQEHHKRMMENSFR